MYGLNYQAFLQRKLTGIFIYFIHKSNHLAVLGIDLFLIATIKSRVSPNLKFRKKADKTKYLKYTL